MERNPKSSTGVSPVSAIPTRARRPCYLPLIVLFFAAISLAADINVIPKPARINPRDGVFTLTATTEIFAPEQSAAIAEPARYFARHLRLATGFLPKVTLANRDDIPRNSILLTT